MQITVDPTELDALGQLYESSQQELSGIVDDIRRRMLNIDFGQLARYGINTGTWLAEIDHDSSRLTDDTIRLQQGAAELRQQLWQVVQAQPGGLGPYAAALPDLWWFKARALPDGPGPAAGLGAAMAPAAPAAPVAGTLSGGQIVATAEQWIGIPYLWGGGHGAVVGPRGVNVDCSGLVHEVFGENGFNIGGTAATMYASGTPVASLAQAQPGDLLFWGTPGNIHHVAIYIGNGQMIEAPHTGAWVHETAVYGGDFAGIRRVLPG